MDSEDSCNVHVLLQQRGVPLHPKEQYGHCKVSEDEGEREGCCTC